MSNNACLSLIGNIEGLVLKETLRIVDVILEVSDALIDLSFSLKNRLSHLLSHQRGICLLILSKDVLKVSKFLEATLEA